MKKNLILLLFILLLTSNITIAKGFEIETLNCAENLKFQITPDYLKNLNNDELVSNANQAKGCSNFSAVVSYDTELIERQPNNHFIYNQRAWARMALYDYDGAISDYTKLLSINYKGKKPEHSASIYYRRAWVYYSRAMTHKNKKDYSAAILDFTESIKLKPKNPEAFQFRGSSKIALSRDPFVLQGFERGLMDIGYAKEQYLQLGDIEKYQSTLKTYKSAQELKKELLQNSGLD